MLLNLNIPFDLPPDYIKLAICWQPNTNKPIVPIVEKANTPKQIQKIKPLTTPEINLLIIFHLTLSYFNILSNNLTIKQVQQPNINQNNNSQNIVVNPPFISIPRDLNL